MRSVLAVCALVLGSNSFACGICIDDKVASAYDHGVVAGARAREVHPNSALMPRRTARKR